MLAFGTAELIGHTICRLRQESLHEDGEVERVAGPTHYSSNGLGNRRTIHDLLCLRSLQVAECIVLRRQGRALQVIASHEPKDQIPIIGAPGSTRLWRAGGARGGFDGTWIASHRAFRLDGDGWSCFQATVAELQKVDWGPLRERRAFSGALRAAAGQISAKGVSEESEVRKRSREEVRQARRERRVAMPARPPAAGGRGVVGGAVQGLGGGKQADGDGPRSWGANPRTAT